MKWIQKLCSIGISEYKVQPGASNLLNDFELFLVFWSVAIGLALMVLSQSLFTLFVGATFLVLGFLFRRELIQYGNSAIESKASPKKTSAQIFVFDIVMVAVLYLLMDILIRILFRVFLSTEIFGHFRRDWIVEPGWAERIGVFTGVLLYVLWKRKFLRLK